MKVAILVLVMLLVVAIAMLCAGVFLLAGLGWCLVTGALVAFVIASFLFRSVRRAINA
ncbi:hypothetical protein [Bordetella genomosp. 9]|uniref:hypothetical protein n=1 Tax=Bordetella genomosp. 9 TaxID=1416803 RepID=UPI0015C5DEC8|nr:hypothetical protein [Bordetella genomosp. 9]